MLGERLKNKRIELRMTQNELAEGICEQSQISRIEKMNYAPSSDVLYQLSKRLGVKMDYFFDETIPETVSELQRLKGIFSDLLKKKDYKAVEHLLNLELDKSTLFSKEDRLYIEWLKGIILYHIQGEKRQAVQNLELIVNDIEPRYVYYLDFLNTLASFYYEMNRIEDYKKMYHHMLEKVGEINLKLMDNFKILVKIRYNYSRFLMLSGNTTEAIKEILEIIDLCKKNDCSYCMADLYCLLANVSEKFTSVEEVLTYYQNAKLLYKLFDNELMYLSLQKYLTENYPKNNIKDKQT